MNCDTKYPEVAAATHTALHVTSTATTIAALTREINTVLNPHPNIRFHTVRFWLLGARRMDYWMALYLYTSPDSTPRVKKLALTCMKEYAPDVWQGVTA